MRAIKRFVFAVFVLAVIVGVSGLFFTQFYLEPLVKQKIEEKGSAALGTPLSVGGVSVGFVFPFTITLRDVIFNLNDPKVVVKIPRIRLIAHVTKDVIDVEKPLGRLDILLSQPEIDFQIANPSEEKPKAVPTQGPPVSPARLINEARDLALNLRVDGAIVSARMAGTKKTVSLSPINISMNFQSLRGDVAFAFDARAIINWDAIQITLPVAMRAVAKLVGDRVSVSKASGDVGGLSIDAQGFTDLVSGKQSWFVKNSVAELSKLKVPPSFLPPGTFSGAIFGVTAANTDGKTWSVDSQIDLKDFKGTTEFKNETGKLKGTITADASVRAQYDQNGLRLPKLAGSANLDQADISIVKMLSKPVGIPASFTLQASGAGDTINLQQASMRFANLKGEMRGELKGQAGGRSKLNIQIEPTSLAGWEKYLPMLAASPVTGSVEVKVDIEGDLRAPESLNVKLAPLLVDNLRGSIDWISADAKTIVKGPLELDARINLESQGKDLRGADVTLDAQLTKLAISKADTFQKQAGMPLLVKLQAKKSGQVVAVQSSRIILGTGLINLSGNVQEPQRPKLALSAKLTNLDLGELTKMLPSMKPYNLSGDVTGSVNLDGTYDFEQGIQRSPLSVRGELKAIVPTYVYKSQAPTDPQASAPNAAAVKPEPLLPDWPIARSAQLKTDISVAAVFYNEVRVNGVRVLSSLTNGNLKGNVAIAKIFDSRVDINELQMNLAQPQPTLKARVKFTGLNANEAMTWISKDYKDLIRGSASGDVNLSAAHPSRADFVTATEVGGRISIANAFLSTVQIDRAVNDVLSKVPGIGEQNLISSKGVAANIVSEFSYSNGRLGLNSFDFVTPEKNEISGRGFVGLDKNFEFSGTAFLATAPVRGSVRAANSDPSGRFVIPLVMKGNIFKPQISFAQNAIEAVLRKTAEFEIDKAKGQATAKIKSEIKKEEVKAKKKAESEIKKFGEKALKGIFK